MNQVNKFFWQDKYLETIITINEAFLLKFQEQPSRNGMETQLTRDLI